jgi:hypothetical protein
MPSQLLARLASAGPPISLAYELHGDAAAQPVVLLVCGLGQQLTVRAAPGRLSALSVLHSKLGLYSTSVWARRARNCRKRRFRRGQEWPQEAFVQRIQRSGHAQPRAVARHFHAAADAPRVLPAC